MAITAIKEIRNEASGSASVLVTNMENPSASENTVELGPAGSIGQCNIWIPWCPSVTEFDVGKYIKVEVRAPPTPANPTPLIVTHLIWQAYHDEPSGGLGCFLEFVLFPILLVTRAISRAVSSPGLPYGDAVRTTTGTTYSVPGTPISGGFVPGGDRTLVIGNGSVELRNFP